MRDRRYPPAVDWRTALRGTGRTLIWAGTLILLFVAYQLWGTGLAEARSQRSLVQEFEEQVATPPTSAAAGQPPPTAPPAPPEGSAIAIMRIPDIGVEKAVVEGVSVADLKKGPGHYPDTPMPGQKGNAAIAGHRTTYGAPFLELDQLEPGDPILVTTRQGSFRYEVRESSVVRPSEVSVLAPTEDDRLTLTTCHPRYSAKQRLIVVAALMGEAAPTPPPSERPRPSAPAPEGDEPAEDEPGEESPTLEGGLSGENASNTPAILWAAAAATVWVLIWLASRRWRKWPAYILGAPVFLVVLFIFFENFSRLLPADY
ncbi:MAG: class E sortase [Actinobacteria bacterium]|nr:class E sortase [Actinomycetota bacterium]